MPDLNAAEPIRVSENAGLIDMLSAAGRYLTVIVAAYPVITALIGTHDIASIAAYFQGNDGATLIAAVVGIGTLAYGLFHTHKRGDQVATVAADPRVPPSVADIK